MITGLTRPDRGQAMIAGRPFTAWPSPSHVAGVLLDAAAVHPGRSGRGHLRMAATLSGVPSRRADEVLEMLGLADAATRKIGKYSLGMRQRLGIAHALLTNPPLRGHAARGGTVLLSSRVLSEVDQTADRAATSAG